ncbi:DNA-directed DNA polymerase X [Syntrophomonas zehnderi OL-4]|uniref:DNA polymerase beta n=1 Tax=Syntrophomonas zehnderi OL-4 TaxID=690567 RepID=A0A0E4C8K7_9FIRM|nr:DNA polymerase/3'-5' exonuclease PolX [Syntrophomonas zehnderi]CFX54999.1 DNA-directed DNA polymerase X [Syntrophomonas zehnderi OL-4]
MNNQETAEILEKIADLLQIKEDNSFKVRAYRNAVSSIYHLDEDLKTIYQQGRLDQIPGVGKAIQGKIVEILETGSCQYYNELKKEIPASLLEWLAIPGIAHKTARQIYKKLGISTLDELYQAAVAQTIQNLPGMGAKSEEKIIKGIEYLKGVKDKTTLGEALPVARDLYNYLQAFANIEKLSPVGSVRRGKSLVGDLDILVASRDEAAVRKYLRDYPWIKVIKLDESGHVTGILKTGLPFEVIIVEPQEYVQALFWTTGSKEHCRVLLDNVKPDLLRGVASEEELYKRFNMDYIPPELRENRGEVEAAQTSSLPARLELHHIKGDLHVHTDWSDGKNSLEEMAEAARALNYEYLAITDHSRSLTVSSGLSPEKLLLQGEQIDRLNRKWDDFRLLKGIEVDILKDGSLDLPDDVLAGLDIVVASIHSAFNLDKKAQTQRLVKAINNEHVDIIGHLTGRLLKRRPGYEFDLDKILEESARNHKILEINSHPDRLDVDEDIARRAKDMGIKIAINSDAHHKNELSIIQFGIITARRGWLEKEDIINTSTYLK